MSCFYFLRSEDETFDVPLDDNLRLTPTRNVTFGELIQVPKRVRPTGPGGRGRGRGRGRGNKMPNPLLTSPESAKWCENSHNNTAKKEILKKEKDEVCKNALAQRNREKRLEKKRLRDREITLAKLDNIKIN